MASLTKRISLSKTPVPHISMDFLEAQKAFFRNFMEEGFEELFDEISPIEDYTSNSWEISFEDVTWGDAKLNFRDAQLLGQTYDAPVHVNIRLLNKKTGEI